MESDAVTAWPPFVAREGVLRELETALEKTPEALDARFYYASFLRDHGRFADAIAMFERILAVVPDHVDTLIAAGVVLWRHGRRLEARAMLERAVAHAGDHAGALVNLANLLAVDEPQRAEALFRAALARDPRCVPAHRGLCSLAATARDAATAALHREAGYRGEPFARMPYYGATPPIPVLALMSTDGGNVPPAAMLDQRVFLVYHVFVECYRGEALPPHALIVNAIADAERGAVALRYAGAIARGARVAVVNDPRVVATTGRVENAARLAGLADIVVPQTLMMRRDAPIPQTLPVILRVPGQQMGRDMALANDAATFAAAMQSLPGDGEVIAIRYIETKSGDGNRRKFRVMWVDGVLYPLHLAISHRWSVHYFSSEMRERDDYRTEEARYLNDPIGAIGRRAWDALVRICEVLELDYMGIDFALLDDGRIVIFEANAAMTALPPDPDPFFDYRRPASETIDAALLAMFRRRATGARRDANGAAPT